MPLFYLHGFASGAGSSKATFFRERLAQLGITLHCPDFNEPDFATLTITRMLDQLDAAIDAGPAEPVTLIGSSLGGYTAWHAAARRADTAAGRTRPITALVLLAPAFEFGANRMRDLGADGIARWRETNRLDVFHYGYGETRALQFALYEDAARYNSTRVEVRTPTLVFQGRQDALVDPVMVERFVASRPSMTLDLLDDDHQLLASLEHIWKATAAFLHLDRV